MVNILSNGIDFLSIAKGPYANNGIGLSSNSRALTSKFLSSGTTLFNSLIIAAEDQEANLALQIRALRSSSGADRADVVLLSQTRGTEVDTDA